MRIPLAAFFVLVLFVSASDADTQTCGDHDGSGDVGVSDALRVLRRAVGQQVELQCPQVCGLPTCGDQSCDSGETCETCASDCGVCSNCSGGSPETTLLDSEEQAFLSLVNAYRADHGRGAVQNCRSMSRSTQGHAEDMRDQNYFSTVGKDGSSLFDRLCDACFARACNLFDQAEAIGAGFSTAAAMLDSFKDSPSIAALLLDNDADSIGIGRATGGGTYGTYWVVDLSPGTEASCD
ncbi:MAG TPA: CAP domain-containing protein [Candidatus Limnocylindrales bacterium]|nr:CAP domain-containing protein [Candidatus Limnocylindrales bacterium]